MNTGSMDADEIVSRMRTLRAVGHRDVKRMHHQAERMVDWREYVQAQPLVAVAAASVAGFTLVRYLVSEVSDTGTNKETQSTNKAAGLLGLVGGLASAAVRQWLTEYVKRELRSMNLKRNEPNYEPTSVPSKSPV